MKNKIKKTTVNSLFNSIQFNSIQFNSIQFNSIPKIVFLTALLFILLFSISCKTKQKPEEHSRAELEGAWEGGISIYDDTIMHTFYGMYGKYKYIGKVDENFYYPYTVTIKRDDYNGVIGTITFNSSTNCIVHYTKEYYDSMISWKVECIDTNHYRNYKKLEEYMENPA